MDWSASTWWWLAGGMLVAAELATGTFYLLMLSIGTAAAALAAHAGFGLTWQLVAAALIGGGATAAWHLRRAGTAAGDTAADPNLNLDVGERVHVDAWDADAAARVHYRGTEWPARYAGHDAPRPGVHRIRAIEGSRLLLERTS